MFRLFLPYLRKFKKELSLAVVCLVLEDSVELTIPLVLADIMDSGIVHGDIGIVIRGCGLMLLLALIALLFGRTYARQIAKGGQGFGAELRKAQFEKVQRFSFLNVDHFSSSGLLTRLTGDVQIIQNMITSGIRPAVRGVITIFVAMIFSFSLDRRLAMIFMVMLPILGIGLLVIIRSVYPLFPKQQASVDRMNMIIQENLLGIQIVKAFCREDHEEAKFLAAAAEQRRVAEKSNRISSLSTPLMQFSVYATICGMLLYGGHLYLQGLTTIGVLTGILTYLRQVLNSMMMVTNVFLLITRSAASTVRVAEVLNEKPDITDADMEDIAVEQGDIRFEHVYFKYEQNAPEYVLSDITLHFSPGQTIGIIGGTGSAKSSLVQLIPRLYDVSKGTVLIDGRPVKKYPLHHLRDAVGVVLQKNTLFSGTIAENLRWGNADADDEELRAACRDAGADEFISGFTDGYQTRLGRHGAGLSGGQTQRICIARALLKHPKILILDDCTSAVDTATETRIWQNLRSHYPNMTKIIIAQRISSVIDADQIVILQDGKVEAFGTHEELLAANEIYREIFHSQLEGALL